MLTPISGYENLTKGSNKKVLFKCSCGNETYKTWKYYINGDSKTCGECNALGEEYWRETKFGFLLMADPIRCFPGSNKKVSWKCDCGGQCESRIIDVTRGFTKSCGKCNNSYISDEKFGKLRIKEPRLLSRGSHESVAWLCDCGNETEVPACNVLSGNTKSCGKCNLIIKFDQIHMNNILSLIRVNLVRIFKPPNKSDFNECNSPSVVETGQRDIFDFIISLGVNAELEYNINGLNYDICVKDKKLLIEFNGLRWHSMPVSKNQDIKKYKNALQNNWDLISIFEDEWYRNRQNVEKLLRNRLLLTKSKSLRPSDCEIKLIDHTEADKFYSANHYIGPCKPKINYGVYYNDELIACASFKRPTRQHIKHDWELVRMSSVPEFRIHGIWSKILRRFTYEYPCESVVSYSDNRLFNGKVYERIGFKYDGDVVSDYYWVKGLRRFHKSALRKTKSEKTTGKTESELREAQGYRKVWDLGKKRWVYKV